MTTRRDFLKKSGVLAAGLGMTSPLFPEDRTSLKKNTPSDRVNVAVIGVRMGCNNLAGILTNDWVHCVGMCDVDSERLENAAGDFKKRFPGNAGNIRLYNDFRHVLDNKDVDGVIIATPDHWHAYMFAEALKAGKAIYVEKPVANSIAETLAMVDFQQKYKGVVTTGLWQTSQQFFREANGLLSTGILGDVYKVHIYLCQTTNPRETVTDSEAPDTIDYDMWLGPAPQRRYNQGRVHGWRGFWDYGGGQQTDWGVHWIDSAFDGLQALGLSGRTYPKAVFSAAYKNPATFNETPSCQTTVFQYDDFHIEWTQQVTPLYNRNLGVAWIGSKGTLVCNRMGYELIVDGKSTQTRYIGDNSGEIRSIAAHTTNWAECIRENSVETNSPIEKGAFATILAHMANISYRTETRVTYDPKTRKFVNNPAADAFLKPVYRDKWKFPTV